MKNFETILDSLAETIERKNQHITFLEWQLADLKKKLEEAESSAVQAVAEANGVLCKQKIEIRKEPEA